MRLKAKARCSFKLVDGVRMNFLTKHPKVVRNWIGKKIPFSLPPHPRPLPRLRGRGEG